MKQGQPDNTLGEIKARISDHLLKLYPDENIDAIADEIILAMGFDSGLTETESHINLWDETDVVTITYGDSIKKKTSCHWKLCIIFLMIIYAM